MTSTQIQTFCAFWHLHAVSFTWWLVHRFESFVRFDTCTQLAVFGGWCTCADLNLLCVLTFPQDQLYISMGVLTVQTRCITLAFQSPTIARNGRAPFHPTKSHIFFTSPLSPYRPSPYHLYPFTDLNPLCFWHLVGVQHLTFVRFDTWLVYSTQPSCVLTLG